MTQRKQSLFRHQAGLTLVELMVVVGIIGLLVNLPRWSMIYAGILIALLPDDSSTANFDRSSINETFKKPFDAALLAERLRTLIGAKKELV